MSADTFPLVMDLGPAGRAVRCLKCNGQSFIGHSVCENCFGSGYTGIDPTKPCSHPAGSRGKAAIIAARYQLGIPLYHPEDSKEVMCD